MNTSTNAKVGDLRPSQIMFTFGVGAIVDLPHMSVVVKGLDDWPTTPDVSPRVVEDRLLWAVRRVLGQQVQYMAAPPAVLDGAASGPYEQALEPGIPVAPFPQWLFCPRCQRLAPLSTGLFQLVDKQRSDRIRYVHANCNQAAAPPVVPVRFLTACKHGHLDDFPWVEFVHRGSSACPSSLRLLEYGASGEARDLLVKCDTCSSSRYLSDAFGWSGRRHMPRCRGRRPHLGDYDAHQCSEQARAILLGASNLWFPDVLSTVAIPTVSATLDHLVAAKWGTLQLVKNLQTIPFARLTGQLAGLHAYSDEEIWVAIERKRQQDQDGAPIQPYDLKRPEWEVLTHPEAQPSTDDFRLQPSSVPAGFSHVLERVVLVERMREVRALVGFTRIEEPGESDEAPSEEPVQRMGLTRGDPTWVPATEVRGEGIFIVFREDRLISWLGQNGVKERDQLFRDAHVHWRRNRGLTPPEANYPGMRFVLIHSFAHALMRQLALECGYSAASIRERIYSRNPGEGGPTVASMAGVLLYTAAPDSEGTLGGLVSLGRPAELGRHIRAALRAAALCAADPLCAEHAPDSRVVTVHGAACHACMFSPETSCERGNKYLDRSTLVPTMEHADLAFFELPE